MGCGASAGKKYEKTVDIEPVQMIPEASSTKVDDPLEAALHEESTSLLDNRAPVLDNRAPEEQASGNRAPEEEGGGHGDPEREGSGWWSTQSEWVQYKASEICAAYNFFFEHIGLRKGWRTAPFSREEVQTLFLASAEVVAMVRQSLDDRSGGGVILRQLEGSAMNFLWGWSPGNPPGASSEATEEFFRGLVFATLSDGHGLVEGLDAATVEHYVSSHPLIAACGGSLFAKQAEDESAACGGSLFSKEAEDESERREPCIPGAVADAADELPGAEVRQDDGDVVVEAIGDAHEQPDVATEDRSGPMRNN